MNSEASAQDLRSCLRKAKAKIEFRYKDAKTAQKISYLLEVDNKIPKVGATPLRLAIAIAPKKIKTESRGNRVITHIEHEKLGTLLATIDDLLFCERLIEDLVCWT
ncbi:MAG: KEOPS complex subunit Pcc1 [Methanobacteriota archaeon]